MKKIESFDKIVEEILMSTGYAMELIIDDHVSKYVDKTKRPREHIEDYVVRSLGLRIAHNEYHGFVAPMMEGSKVYGDQILSKVEESLHPDE